MTEIPLDDTVPPGEPGEAQPAPYADDLLPRTPLFASLDPVALRELMLGVKLVRYAEDEVIFREGEPGEALYVIAEGAVSMIAEGKPRRLLNALAEGQFFGEVSVVTRQPRIATARALVDTTLIRVDRATITRLVERSPRALKVLLRFLQDRLIQRVVTTSRIFEPLIRTARLKLARKFRFLEIDGGTAVVRQAAASDALFVVVSGSLAVVQSDPGGESVLATLGSGDVFGEMSLVTGEPAMASVVARSKAWLLALPRSDVADLLTQDPAVRARIEQLIQERQRQNELSLSPAAAGEPGRELV